MGEVMDLSGWTASQKVLKFEFYNPPLDPS